MFDWRAIKFDVLTRNELNSSVGFIIRQQGSRLTSDILITLITTVLRVTAFESYQGCFKCQPELYVI